MRVLDLWKGFWVLKWASQGMRVVEVGSYLESVCWTQSNPLASPSRDTVNWNVLEVSESRTGMLMT